MAKEWFARVMGSELGPMEAADLVKMVEQRQLTPEDQIRRGANGQWVLAASAKGLFDAPSKNAVATRSSVPQPIEPKPSAVAPVQAEIAPVAGQKTKACHFCGEQVLEVAKKCKHCGETLDVVLRAAEEAKRTAELSRSNAGNVIVQQSVAVAGGYIKKPWPHHGDNLFLTICTCGLWSPIWIIGYAGRDKDVYS